MSVVSFWDFYFRAPGSLVVLTFPQPVNFSSLLPKLLCETLTDAQTVGCRQVSRIDCLLMCGATSCGDRAVDYVWFSVPSLPVSR